MPIVEEGNDVLVVPPEMTNWEIREALLALARYMSTHVNLSVEPRDNVMKSTITPRLNDFVRMNPTIFLGSKVGEDLPEFLDGFYNVLSYMGMNPMEKAELVLYQLMEISTVWYTHWKDSKQVKSGPIEWEKFKDSSLGKYFPR